MAIHLNERNLEAIARGPAARRASVKVAQAIAERVNAMKIPVGDDDADGITNTISIPVRVYDDGEEGAVVSLAHPAGIAVQAKYGALTRAASSVGLEVHGG